MKEKRITLSDGSVVICSAPTDKNEIKRNLQKFNNVCNQIFADKKKYKHLFYSEEEIEYLKKHPERCKELNIKFI